MATKHYQVKVPEQKAPFFEELLTNLQFVDFTHTKTTGMRSQANLPESKTDAATRYNLEHDQEIVKLRDVMKNIEQIRDARTQ